MSIFFTASEVLDIAIQIERNGAAFYRRAAVSVMDKNAEAELLQLADMEDEHEKTFLRLKEDVLAKMEGDDWGELDEQADLYLQSFAAGQVFDITKEAVMDSSPSFRTVLEFALQRERDSILFYLGLREWLPFSSVHDRVEAIIVEEMSHLALLNKRLMEAVSA